MDINIIADQGYKKSLYQWDLNRRIRITGEGIDLVSEVHFGTLVVRPISADGCLTADIPNILLQAADHIKVYLVLTAGEEKYTLGEYELRVIAREKPSDYIYTETEILSYESLEKRVSELEQSGGEGGILKEIDPTVPDWAKQPEKPTYTAEEVGALPEDTGKYKVIQDITLEEDVDQVNISADADGKPFKLTKIRIKITGTVPVARLNVAISGMTNNYYYNAFKANNKTTVIIEIGERIAPENVCTASQISGFGIDDAFFAFVASATQRLDMMLHRTTDCADNMRFWLGDDSEFPAGTRIIVEGVVCNEEVG